MKTNNDIKRIINVGEPAVIITIKVYPQGVECKANKPINGLVLSDILITTASNGLKALMNQNSMIIGKKDGPNIIKANDNSESYVDNDTSKPDGEIANG